MYLLLLKMVIFHGHISFLECIIHLMVLCLVNVGSNSINISPNTPLKFNSQIPKMTPYVEAGGRYIFQVIFRIYIR